MSADNGYRDTALLLVTGLLGCWGSASAADNEEPPGLEFLEYLGSWEGSDEEWVLLSDEVQEAAAREERSDPAPEGEASTEDDDES